MSRRKGAMNTNNRKMSRIWKELNPSGWERAKSLLLPFVIRVVILAPFLAMANRRFYLPTHNDFRFRILFIDSFVFIITLLRLLITFCLQLGDGLISGCRCYARCICCYHWNHLDQINILTTILPEGYVGALFLLGFQQIETISTITRVPRHQFQANRPRHVKMANSSS